MGTEERPIREQTAEPHSERITAGRYVGLSASQATPHPVTQRVHKSIGKWGPWRTRQCKGSLVTVKQTTRPQ
jgi:hypothetical protein